MDGVITRTARLHAAAWKDDIERLASSVELQTGAQPQADAALEPELGRKRV